MRTEDLWLFLPVGYLFTVLVETPVLLFGLSPRHPLRRKLLAGLWLTACTYPVVVLVLPVVMSSAPRWAYIAAAETFAPVAECALFGAAFGVRPGAWRDFAAITAANLASFGAGEALYALGW